MNPATPSPRITGRSWGRLDVEGGLTFKDAKLFPGGAREWNWDETGTQHNPGILAADVQELIRSAALPRILADSLDPWVRGRFLELWDAVAEGDANDPY